MKIPFLPRLFPTRASPKNSLWANSYNFLFGTSTSGKTVNERTAMQTTAVYACVRILAETIASLPLHTYRYTTSGKEKATDHPIYYLIHSEPNPEMTSFVFRETLMGHLLLWGNAYAQIIRDGRGRVIALYPLLPNKIAIKRTDQGQLYYEYDKDGQSHILRSYEVLHIPGLGFDGLIGYSPIAMAKNAIGMAIATEEYGAKLGCLRAERNTIIQQIEGQDERLKQTDELITFFDGIENPLESFDAELFETIVDKLVVKERECIIFRLKNGMELEERYELQRGQDKV